MSYSVRVCQLAMICAVAIAPMTALAQTSGAPSVEVREYDVVLQKKPIGKVSIRITQAADGTTVSTTDTAIEEAFLFTKYRYEYHGDETWQRGRLVRLDSRTNDNGKPLAVSAAVDATGSRVEVKGKPTRSGPVLAMTSNYWRLPDALLAAGKFSIVDSDTGALFTVQLRRIGAEWVDLDGRKTSCEHYRVSGDTAAELWFDEQGRLVRQQTVEHGYTTELQLARIRGNVKRE